MLPAGTVPGKAGTGFSSKCSKTILPAEVRSNPQPAVGQALAFREGCRSTRSRGTAIIPRRYFLAQLAASPLDPSLAMQELCQFVERREIGREAQRCAAKRWQFQADGYDRKQ